MTAQLVKGVGVLVVGALLILMFADMVAAARQEGRAACEVWRMTALRCDFCVESLERRPFGCSMEDGGERR